MYFFWVVVIGIGLCSHLLGLIARLRNQEQHWQQVPDDDNDNFESIVEQKTRNIFSTPYNFIKRYITVPATFGYTHSQNIGWCTVPTRIQSITIAAFVIMNIVLCSISYRVFAHNL